MSFYSFITTKSVGGNPQEVAVLYFHENGEFDEGLANRIDQMLNQPLPVNRIVVVCPYGFENAIEVQYSSASVQLMPRLIDTSHVVVVPFDHQGILIHDQILFLKMDTPWQFSDKDLGEINDEAMSKITKDTETVLKAPPGYLFKKPSENSGGIFIRAGNMLKDPAAISVIFHALIRKLPIGAKVIHVDSFTILSIASKLQRDWPALAGRCGRSIPVPSIANFHSYEIDENMRFDGDPDSLILISATTSGGLARKLESVHGANKDQIFHLLVFSSNKNLAKRSVFFEERNGINLDSNQEHQKLINIPGEEFMASHSDAREVRITTKHISLPQGDILKDVFYNDNASIRLGGSGERTYQPVSFLPTAGLGSTHFIKWLSNEVRIRFPVSTQLIVATDEGRSLALAREVQRLMGLLLGEKPQLKTLRQLGGKNPPKIKRDSSIVVVCSEEMLGDSLLRASLALRDVKHLHRHYLCAHFFGEDRLRQERLVSNLTVSGGLSKYGWSCYFTSFIGEARLHHSWQKERELASPLRPTSSPISSNLQLSVALERRLQLLNQDSLSGDQLFYPTVEGEPLGLRPESVLYRKPYKKISQLVVYLQVAAALQRARDGYDFNGKPLGNDFVFVNSPFVDSLLSPNTFEQFSDGVIGAALLRASCPSELNYARCVQMSGQMLRILESIIERRSEKFGEAVLEFLFALHTKKLRLSAPDYSSIQTTITSVPELKAFAEFLSVESLL